MVFNCLGLFGPLIFMKYMFITKCSALVYINNLVCGLRKAVTGKICMVIFTVVMDLLAVGCHGGYCYGAKANSESSVSGLKPLRVLMTQGIYRSLGILQPQCTPFMFGLR